MNAGTPADKSVAVGLDAFDGESLVQIRLHAKPERLRLVRKVVEQVALGAGCSKSCVQDMVIAIDEACQNVVRHAYGNDARGEFVLDIRQCGEHLVFNLVDFADPVDVSRVKPRDLDELRPGGLGTHFIHECMDEVDFLSPPEGAGNRLQMRKRIE